MAFIEASAINSFPSTKRASVNKLMTENSITRLLNRLLDVEGYVITSDINMPEDFPKDLPVSIWDEKDFEFILHGYYFNIAKQGSLSGLKYLMQQANFPGGATSDTTLYALIAIDPQSTDYPELWGQDIVEQRPTKFNGIQFVTDIDQAEGIPDRCRKYFFPIIDYVASTETCTIPFASLLKFDTRAIKKIDGGEMIF